MALPNIKDLLTSFSPTSEFYAVCSGDGRVKIWDTLRGRLQKEFVNLLGVNDNGGILASKPENGHLSVDYTCMQWVPLGKKKKSKPVHLLLVLGTGGGDVLALDVSVGQLTWKVSDCHPGGVTAVSFSGLGSCIYTVGIDGVLCRIDSKTGGLLEKFQASTQSISSLAVFADGELFATASAQLKVFSSDNKKVQKFSGHPVGVRCISFSEDGKFILSSGVGERFIAFWKIDSSKNRSACCVLSMEHPAVSLNCKGSENKDGKGHGLYVLAISETGICYFWHGKDIEELHDCRPTKISMTVMPATSKKNKGYAPAIYSGKFQSIENEASGIVLVACGSIVKPSFKKLTVKHGTNVNISSLQESSLLPEIQSDGNIKARESSATVTALDRANAEDASIPLPKICDYQDSKKRKHGKASIIADPNHQLTTVVKENNRIQTDKKFQVMFEERYEGIVMEDKLKSVGILASEDLISSESWAQILSTANLDAAMFKNACLLVSTNTPNKKKRVTAMSMFRGDAFKLLVGLIIMWKTRSVSEEKVVPWICHIMTDHGYSIMSEESSVQILDGLNKMTKFKRNAMGPILRLSGSIQLINAQIAKGNKDISELSTVEHVSASDKEDEDIDEVLYGDETYQSSSDEE